MSVFGSNPANKGLLYVIGNMFYRHFHNKNDHNYQRPPSKLFNRKHHNRSPHQSHREKNRRLRQREKGMLHF